MPDIGGLRSAPVDSTTACGFHEILPGRVMQRGHSKDHRPDLAQLKLMTVAMHPFGHLAAADVVPGKTADDVLFPPIIARTRAMIGGAGRALGRRFENGCACHARSDRPRRRLRSDRRATGEMVRLMPALIAAAVSGQQRTKELRNENGEAIGCGDEFERQCAVALAAGANGALEEFIFTGRVQVIRSDAQQAQQSKALDERLLKAEAGLRALTPEPGRGRRQHQTAESLQTAIKQTLAVNRVAGLLKISWRVEEKRETRFVGRGRGGGDRPTREEITPRDVITEVTCDEAAIAAQKERLGWRVQLSNAPRTISLESCVNHSRGNWRGERNYHRLKSEPLSIGPLLVRKDGQIIGQTNLLTLAARVESIFEFEVARGLGAEGKKMVGLHSGLPKQETATPTAPALLKAIVRCEITLTLIQWHNETSTHLTPLPSLLIDVLRYLHLPLTLDTGLQKISTFDISNFGK